jgi:hypothetical protein
MDAAEHILAVLDATGLLLIQGALERTTNQDLRT